MRLIESNADAGRSLRSALTLGVIAERTDAELLTRFRSGLATRDEGAEAAFAALVERHARSVVGVARRVLGDEAAALDAAQATFLVLARRAGSIRVGATLAPWLGATARRIALGTHRAEARRRRHEVAAARARPEPVDGHEASGQPHPATREVLAIVLDELARLPEPMRRALSACHLDGLTQHDAARALGWPVGTLQSRLDRGRKRLRDRLARRGVTTLGLPTLLPHRVADAWVVATGRAALGVANGIGPLSASLLAPGAVALLPTAITTTKGLLMAKGLFGTVLLGTTLAVVGTCWGPGSGSGDGPAASPSSIDDSFFDQPVPGPVPAPPLLPPPAPSARPRSTNRDPSATPTAPVASPATDEPPRIEPPSPRPAPPTADRVDLPGRPAAEPSDPTVPAPGPIDIPAPGSVSPPTAEPEPTTPPVIPPTETRPADEPQRRAPQTVLARRMPPPAPHDGIPLVQNDPQAIPNPVDGPDLPTLLCFLAQDSDPCAQMLEPLGLLNARQYPIRLVDINRSPDLKVRYKVTVVPMFVLIDGSGRELARTGGVQSPQRVADFYNQHRPRTVVGATESADAEPALHLPPPIPRPWETVARIRMISPSKKLMGVASGVVVQSDATGTKILTAEHTWNPRIDPTMPSPPPGELIVQNGRFLGEVTVDLFDGTLREGNRVAVSTVNHAGTLLESDPETNLLLIGIKPGRVLPVSPVIRATWTATPGLDLIAVGCTRGNDPTAWSTKVLSGLVVPAPGAQGQSARKILCSFFPSPERAGGGLFTPEGELVGICNDTDENHHGGLYADPQNIRQFLTRCRVAPADGWRPDSVPVVVPPTVAEAGAREPFALEPVVPAQGTEAPRGRQPTSLVVPEPGVAPNEPELLEPPANRAGSPGVIVSRSKPARPSSGQPPSPEPTRSNTDRRLDELERKLDRLLEKLDNRTNEAPPALEGEVSPMLTPIPALSPR